MQSERASLTLLILRANACPGQRFPDVTLRPRLAIILQRGSLGALRLLSTLADTLISVLVHSLVALLQYSAPLRRCVLSSLG